jgi:CDP-paratose 2-epimerase
MHFGSMEKQILITGGCGFIGSNLAVALAEKGYGVTCFDNLSRRGSELLLSRILAHGCTFCHGDIRCPEDLSKLKQDYSTIIECSAEPSVMAGALGSGANYLISNNLVGAINCFEFARERGISVLFLSTSRVYPYDRINRCRFKEGQTRYIYDDTCNEMSTNGISISFPLDGPRSLYGATKLCAEHLLQEYCAQYGMKGIINRCGVIAGPWQLGKVDQGIFTYWLAQHYFRRPSCYIGFGGKGKQVRDLLHVDDLAMLILRQLEQIDHFQGEVFNVGGSVLSNLSLMETTRLCQEITGNDIEISSQLDTRPADVIWFIMDNGETTTIFDWKPSKDGQRILEDIYEWLKTNEDKFSQIFGG